MSAVAVKPRESFLYNPKGITAATFLMVIVWAVIQWNPSAFMFLVVVALFIIGWKKPLWAVAAVLVSQMTITSYIIVTPLVDISLRLILLLLILFIIRGALSRKEVDLGPHSRKLIIPMAILIVIFAVSDLYNGLPFDTVFKAFRNMTVGLLFIILLPAVVESRQQLKILFGIVFIVAIASSVVGVLQHYNVLGMGQATITPDFLSMLDRVPGMGETELELSYIIPAALVIILTLYLVRGISSRHRNFLFIPMVPMLLALWFTYTRSALLAIGIGVVSVFLFIGTKIRWEIILIIIAGILFFIEGSNVFEETYLSGRAESAQEESSVARDILRQTGIAIALDNPIFGIGSEQFLIISPQYASSVDPSLIEWEGNRYYSYTTLGNDEPHNDFIMMWLSHGTLALILYVVLYFVIIYNLMYSFRTSNNRFIRGLSAGLAAALITYVVNSFYHNLLATLPLLWILAGFSLVTAKLASQERKSITV
jgi:O-antigen ligase